MKSASHNDDMEPRRLSLVDWQSVDDPLLQQALMNARTTFPSDWSEGKLEKLLAVLDRLISKAPLLSDRKEYRHTSLIELVADQLQLGHLGLNKLREEIGGEFFCCALAFYAATTGERDAAIRFSEQAKAEALLPDAIRWRKDAKRKARGRESGTCTTRENGARTRKYVLETAAELRKQGRSENSIAETIRSRSKQLDLTRSKDGISLRHIRRIIKENRP